jgi:hypothetical protein
MRRIAILFLTLLAIVAGLASGAVAKGATGAALTGPGLDEPIDFNIRASSRIASFSGLYNGGGLGSEADPRDRTLGPRYVLTFEFTGEEEFEIVQHVYPYAPSGPWIFTPEQDLYGNDIGPFWTQTSDFFLDKLVREGLPETAPVAPKDEPAAPSTVPAAPTSVPRGWITLATVLIAGAAILLIRSRRTVAQK